MLPRGQRPVPRVALHGLLRRGHHRADALQALQQQQVVREDRLLPPTHLEMLGHVRKTMEIHPKPMKIHGKSTKTMEKLMETPSEGPLSSLSEPLEPLRLATRRA